MFSMTMKLWFRPSNLFTVSLTMPNIVVTTKNEFNPFAEHRTISTRLPEHYILWGFLASSSP